jgi:hypothetical protein
MIRYFTPRVTRLPGFDPTSGQRQDVYLRALRTCPKVSIHLGEYGGGPARLPIHPPPAHGNPMATVLKSTEKGSDVNLASYLLLDGFQRRYEQAIVLSNDADLVTPVGMVRTELGRPVGIVLPCTNAGRSPVTSLRKVATFTRNVHEGAIKASQFLNHLTDATGTFSKPPTW